MIPEINNLYYHYLRQTLNDNLMGTEQSIFTIIAHKHPDIIHRFDLDGKELMTPFFEMLKSIENDNIDIGKNKEKIFRNKN